MGSHRETRPPWARFRQWLRYRRYLAAMVRARRAAGQPVSEPWLRRARAQAREQARRVDE